MKRILLVSLFHFSFIILNTFAQQYGWIDISGNIPPFPYDTTIINGGQDTIIAGLTDVFFIDDNEGWITTYHPFDDTAAILHTTDGGTTFSTQNTTLPTEAIHMVSATEGYCGGQSGFVYRTIDGGVTWPFLGTITNTLTDVDFATASQGYACGFNGAVWSITPGGVTNLNTGLGGTFSGISSPSVNNVWVCGGSSIFYYNGTNFTEQSAPTGSFSAIYFLNNLEGWVVGTNGIIAHTTDGGASWPVQRISGSGASLFDVFFLNSNEGWAVGINASIVHTTDGGTTWNVEGTGLTNAFLTGVHFTSSTNGYVVGNGKTLLKYTQLTSVENEAEMPTEFTLEQNYPNPFNPSTKIKYTIPTSPLNPSPYKGEGQRERSVTLKVYDVLGNEVATLVNEEKPAGKYEVEFNVSIIPSGIYFYQLKVGPYVKTKKMILIK